MSTTTDEKAQTRLVRPAMVEVKMDVTGQVVVCDPCYYTEDGTTDPGELGFTFDGTGSWTVTTEVANEGAWGFRVAELLAVRDDSLQFHGPERVANDDMGVDAGLMAFIPTEAGRVKDWSAFCDEIFKGGFDEGGLRGQPFVVQGRVISSTGYGDGTYNCYVREDEAGRVCQVRVAFLEEPEEDEVDWSSDDDPWGEREGEDEEV